MFFRFLKWARVVVSLIFFLLIGIILVDFGNTFSSGLINGVLFFQFIPSILKFINIVAVAAAGFIIVMILTFLFGRVYCSWLCPLGTMQDVLHRIVIRFKKRKRFKFHPAVPWFRYGILTLTILFIIFGSVFFLNLLDPYSSFGKITSNLVRPVWYGLNNTGAWLLGKFENYSLFKVELKSYSWASFGYSLALLGLITWLVYKHGRLYCNTVCPVGTLLGIASRFSIFKIRLDETLCNSCGICGSNCKAECIDTKNRTVDFSRCVGCMNCLTSCSSNGVRYSLKPAAVPVEKAEPQQQAGRRHFIKNATLVTGGVMSIAGDAFSEGLNDGKIPVKKEFTVTPPGSLSIRHFTQTCTACHLCVSACPTHVIQPSLFQYGVLNMMQPFMDYHAHFCNFECTICGEVCPTGAILPLELEEKKLTQLGISKFIKENCVVYTDEKACGACSEHCPTKAVNMVPYKGREDLKIPEVKDEICIGCGACEYACPTTPKSIYVEGNAVHKLADKPEVEKIEKEVDPEEDFPF